MLPKEQREALMQKLRYYFAGPDTTNPFMKRQGAIRVFAGEEEGVYGWLASNLLQGTLGTDNTWGVVDLGGASAQITYRCSSEDILSNTYEVALTDMKAERIGEERATKSQPGTIRLFTHSFLYFGQQQSALRLDAKII